MKQYYAGIGSRKTPEPILRTMTSIAKGLDKRGYQLSSGGAKGADSAFLEGVRLNNHQDPRIFYPNDPTPLWTNIFTEFFHPAPDRLDNFGRKAMNRNAMIMLGREGNSPVAFVVCWTPDGKTIGGTGQAMKIAHFFNIRIFNLYYEEDVIRLKNFVKGK